MAEFIGKSVSAIVVVAQAEIKITQQVGGPADSAAVMISALDSRFTGSHGPIGKVLLVIPHVSHPFRH